MPAAAALPPLPRAEVLRAVGAGRAGVPAPVVLPVVHVADAEQAVREATAALAAGCCGVQLIGQRRECYDPGDAAELRRCNAQLLLLVQQGTAPGVKQAVPGMAGTGGRTWRPPPADGSGRIADDAERWLHAAPARPADGEFYTEEAVLAAGLRARGVAAPRAAALAGVQRRRGLLLQRYALPLPAFAAAIRAVRARVPRSAFLCVNWWGRALPDAGDALLRPLWRDGVRVDALLADREQAAVGTAAAAPGGAIAAAAAALRAEYAARFPGRRFLYFAGVASKGVGGVPPPAGGDAALRAALSRPLCCDAVVTSGDGTGKAAAAGKLAWLRRAAGGAVCTGVASGVTPKNAGDCVAGGVDLVFVASGVAKDWHTLDPARVAALHRALAAARAAAEGAAAAPPRPPTAAASAELQMEGWRERPRL